MIDIGLLNKTLEAIDLHPEKHVQAEWRCRTGQCLAGWVGVVTGAKWLYPDDPDDAFVVHPETGREMHVSDYAAELLGDREIFDLTEEEYNEIYAEDPWRGYNGGNWSISYEQARREMDGGPVGFSLFYGRNTKSQLRGALSVIDKRQAKK